MKKPIISIIMATYNHARFVAQSIKSVLEQRDVEFEFLITDDGSCDNSVDIISSFKDARIKFFPHKVNQGACIVTNVLIKQAQGEFIALINSDDYWIDSYKLAEQLQLMQDNPLLAACFGWAKFIDKDNKPINKDTLPFGRCFEQGNKTQGRWLRQFFDFGNCICHPTMLIRKSCYEALGLYNNRLRQLPDLDMWVRLIKKYPIYIINKELINFRILPGENASCQTVGNSIRTMNEHYLIAETFFTHVSREVLIDGFSDLLTYKDIPTQDHLDIEKALLYFKDNQWLGKPYKLIGLSKLYQLLNSNQHYKLLVEAYGIDDKWFQKQTSEIDVLRPKLIAQLSQKKSFVKQFLRQTMRSLFS